jgi:hypothetical protein
MIETCWLVGFTLSQMPLANHGSLVIAVSLELLGDVGERLVDLGDEGVDAIDVVVRSRQDRGARGGTDRVGHVAVIEEHAFFGDAIQVGRVIDPRAIAADGLGRVVVAGA